MLLWALLAMTSTGELRWQAPAEACPTAAEVQAQIDDAGGQGDLHIEGVVRPGETRAWGLELTLAYGELSDTRMLEDDDCGALAEAAVLLVATRLDEVRARERAQPEPEPEVIPEPDPVPEVEPEPEPSPEPAPRRSEPDAPLLARERPSRAQGIALGLRGGIGVGSVPTPGIPLELGLGYAWSRFRLSVEGRYHLATLETHGDLRMRVLLGTAGPRGCARLGGVRVEVPLCAELGVGGSRASVQGSQGRDRGGVWLEAGLVGGVTWFFRPQWGLVVQLAGAVPLDGSSFQLDGASVWDPAPVAGRVTLGIEFLRPIQKAIRPEKT